MIRGKAIYTSSYFENGRYVTAYVTLDALVTLRFLCLNVRKVSLVAICAVI